MTGHRLRIAILGINYEPESIGIAPYTTGLATGLAARGHDVEVLTGFPHYPQWKRAEGYAGFRSTDVTAGVRVRRFRHPVPQGGSAIGRTMMELAFGLQLLTTRWNHPEVVVCVSPPLLAAGLAVTRTRLTTHRPALGVLVHDVYSRGVIETGSMSGPAARAVRVMESAVTRHADGVAVIHNGFMTDLVERLGVDRARIRVIRNWTHVAPPDPSASAAYRAARGWGDGEVVILHAGNMGAKQGLENVIAAARLADRGGCRVRFVLLGDGHQRAHLEAEGAWVAALEFVPPIPDDEFPAAIGAADVLLVNERPGVAQMAVPSKLTSYFMSGKPVLAASDPHGITALEVAASGAGICVPAGRPDLLLREAVRLGTDHALAESLGVAGRRYVTSALSADAALDCYEEWIADLAATRRDRKREVHR